MNLRNLTIEQLEALKELKLKELREIQSILDINQTIETALQDSPATEIAHKTPLEVRRITQLRRVTSLSELQLLERNVITLEGWDVTQSVLKDFRELLRLMVILTKNKEVTDVIELMESLKDLHNKFTTEYEPLKGQKTTITAVNKRITKLITMYHNSPLYKEYINQ